MTMSWRAFDPGEGVLDPFWLTRAFADAAIAGGAELRLGGR